MKKIFIICLSLFCCQFLFGQENDALKKGKDLYGKGSYSQAFNYFFDAAQAGSAEAMYYLGTMYEKGQSVTKSVNTALDYYRKSAEAALGMTSIQETSKEQPKPVERNTNERAMYPGRGATANQDKAGGQGNQGVTTGAPDVHVYGEGGNVGEGNKFALTGRNLVGRLPLPAYTVQDQGTVVVTITVDKDGNVIKTTPGAKGSTTLSKTLLDAAEKAARKAKFSRKPDAMAQTGTITYIFKL